jgi:DNA-binding response OmpR family regulator
MKAGNAFIGLADGKAKCHRDARDEQAMRILIAEDEPSFRRLLEKQLSMWGYDVVTVENGKAALRILQSEDPPRLAILDWMMPEMNGIDVCWQLRKRARGPYIYILLLTSQQRDEDLVAGMEAGADDYVTKPFKHNELRLRLRSGRRIIELKNELSAVCDTCRSRTLRDPLIGL